MFIQIFPSGPYSTNAYLVACSITKAAAIIDPAPDSASALLACINEHDLACQVILLTHSHWDHIADVSKLKKKLNIPVYIHSLDVPNLEYPGTDGIPFWIPIEGVVPDQLLEEGQVVKIGHLNWHVLHTPGHSPGGSCLYEPDQNILLSGDTLFKGSIGNLSFPDCQPDLMWPSLAKLAKLPPQTIVYPGHGPHTTIGAESWLPRAKELFT